MEDSRQEVWQLIEERRRDSRNHACAYADRDDEDVVTVAVEIHFAEDFDTRRGNDAEHHDASTTQDELRNRSGDVCHFREQAERNQDQTRSDADIAAADAGDAYQADVLRERGVREGVEDAAYQCTEAIHTQAASEGFVIDFLVDDVAECDEHASLFNHGDDHDQAHADDGAYVELWPAVVERRDHREPVGAAQAIEADFAERQCNHEADDHAH